MKVAPFAGAWIEIFYWLCFYSYLTVAPFAGAWIEMYNVYLRILRNRCRSLRGSVD